MSEALHAKRPDREALPAQQPERRVPEGAEGPAVEYAGDAVTACRLGKGGAADIGERVMKPGCLSFITDPPPGEASLWLKTGRGVEVEVKDDWALSEKIKSVIDGESVIVPKSAIYGVSP